MATKKATEEVVEPVAAEVEEAEKVPAPKTPRQVAIAAVEKAHSLVEQLQSTSGREKALALTKLDESFLWLTRVN